jgi:hypothetical protein
MLFWIATKRQAPTCHIGMLTQKLSLKDKEAADKD